jgi:polysaccharide export outer membrane protein
MVPRKVLAICRLSATLLIAAASAQGCSGGPAPALQFSQPSKAGGLTDSYRFGVGDKVKVLIYGEPDLSGAVEVNALGNVAVPLIGEVPAKGTTIDELRSAIASRLAAGYLKSPKVNIEITNYRPIYVQGEVRSGGEFKYRTGLTIRDAIAMAGGYSYRANQGYVVVMRQGEPREVRVDLPTREAVLPGDNIRVPERIF